jgi:Gram-negative porin
VGENIMQFRRALFTAVSVLSLGAIIVPTTPSAAADLGGNCCADLEERIAELEATTARKGNRKVSLTVSGWVNESVFFWDDGVESNIYVGTNSLEQSRVKFQGEAKIVEGWTAGYILELGINGAKSSAFNQDDTAFKDEVVTRKSSWFVKSKDLGKLTVGLDGTATYHLLDDADGANTRNYSDAEGAAVALGGFKTRTGGVAGPKWTDLMGGFNNFTPGQSGRREEVRYDSPAFAGFVVSAAWGADDMWDTALSYKNDIGDFKLTAKAGYGESTDSQQNKGGCAVGNGDCQWYGAAGTIMHAPTGLYVYGGYGATTLDLKATQIAANKDDQSEAWFIQAGIEQKFNSLGKTTLFGEYRNDTAGLSSKADASDLDFWALGIVQNIDAAAMDLYVIYRNSEGEFIAPGAAAATSLDSLDMVIAGGRIQF